MSNKPLFLSGYQFKELLYEGTRTLVYRATRILDNRPAIVKLLRTEYPSFSELVQFRNQYLIANTLDLPGIVRPLSLEPYGKGYALIMEDLGAVSLRQYCKTNGLTLEDFLNVAIQISDILHGLYRHRVIHKDIKPANLIVHPDTKKVQLIDFSIASLLSKETQEIKHPNVLEGTLAYLSPEQTGRMNRGIDYRTDFYTLGVTFFELLTGQLPFRSKDPLELVHCHIAKPAPRVCDLNPEIPEVIGQIVSKLMAKNAENRYQSAFGLKHDLTICLEELEKTGKIENFALATLDWCEHFIIPEKLYGREREVQILLKAFDRIASPKENRVAAVPASIATHFQPDKPHSELMLVSGSSGIGKTAIINEIHKPIVRQQGYFIQGKFDQCNHNIPFEGFVKAFRDLMGQILSESDDRIDRWRSKIIETVGDSGQVLVEVIPELEILIGKQAEIVEFSGSAAQTRFNLLFQKFVRVFTTEERPLVIFLDDLQWADSASLSLLKLLLEESDRLLILGAYRDNEVSPLHPFAIALNDIKQAGTTVNTITLSPLSPADLEQLIADTLSVVGVSSMACDLSLAAPLAESIYRKTKGNPFFTTQFLKALYDDKLIQFNPPQSPISLSSHTRRSHANLDGMARTTATVTTLDQRGSYLGGWECDLSQIKVHCVTDDVVECMARQLQKLPLETQEILKLAACIGNQFDLPTLAMISNKSLTETASDLWNALEEGLVIPTSEMYKLFQGKQALESDGASHSFPIGSDEDSFPSYKFFHDRIQQAAYSLICESKKPPTHLKIGRRLLSKFIPGETVANSSGLDDRIFEIVNHFNLGKKIISSQSERVELADLNLKAGRKAKISTAYTAALEYFTIGIELLGSQCWEQEYTLTLLLHEKAAEVAYLSSHFELMERLVQAVLEKAKTLLERIESYEVQIKSYLAQNQTSLAIQTGLSTLKFLNVNFPENMNASAFKKEVKATEALLSRYTDEELIHLPEMVDSEALAAMKIMASILAPVHQAEPDLAPFMVLKQIHLSLEYGNAPTTSFAYAWYATFLCAIAENFTASTRAGELSLNLLSWFPNGDIAAKVLNMVYAFVKIWNTHIKELVKPLEEGYQFGLKAGDFEYGGYCAFNYCGFAYYSGQNLNDVEQEMAKYTNGISQSRQKLALNFQTIYHQAVLNLQGKVQEPCRLSGEVYDRDTMLPIFITQKNHTLLFQHYVTQEFLSYLFRNQTEAIYNAARAQDYANSKIGWIVFPIHNFYQSLILIKQYPSQSPSEQKEILKKVYKNRNYLRAVSKTAPMNYLHKLNLVEAEIYRILGNYKEAIEFYDRAIQGASKNGYLQEEAIANELAAEFYLDWGKQKVAAGYLQEAYYCYYNWGAKGKTDDLEKRYNQLLCPILQAPQNQFCLNETLLPNLNVSSISNQAIHTVSSKSSSSNSEFLDLATILKASQALSVEIQLEQLLSRLVEIVMENAGANKCALILLKGDKLVIEAMGNFVDRTIEPRADVLLSIPLESSQDVPRAAINYVWRTQENIVVDDAIASKTLSFDAYIQRQKPKSLLCTPIVNQDKLIGILYLENSLTQGVFTNDRLQVIKLLTAQAAISLENAQLYSKLEDYSYTLEQKVEDRTLQLKEKATQLESTLQKLYATQSQLIQTEKMSSLGQLVAGIAHEINNPVSFIHGNLIHAHEYSTSLIELIDLYAEIYPQPRPEIEAKVAEIDLEYLVEDLPKMLGSMQMGTTRIREIVQSLRNFSRLDESAIKQVDLHSGIDSTLLILQHRFRANGQEPEIQVIKDYAQLPLVNCYASAMNQVFMNLISNSIDALRQVPNKNSKLEKEPTLRIQTSLGDAENVLIRIADNGEGIDPALVHKIFEPFFTTKPVGQGTGLGLSVSYSTIVEKHKGMLSIHSIPGEGTECTIDLPIHGH